MKINFNQPFMKLGTNEPILKPNTKEPFCLKEAAIEALLVQVQEENVSGEEKAKRYVLATRICADPGSIDLTVEELAKIKQVIGKGYGPLVVGQAWEMLDNNFKEK